ncbi:MAG: hypothetical protein RMX68_008735 [Aulosira sp. ZfuVER01]|nr:hypothetical protein [Aulosira sp. ZfuVER01]MDZ7998641.1 hypothetical protein [Aulosira sp. DedVER01a]MDZ8054813.1 hypothetical protein [Aulosira sp. ZfuCHP01]
MNKKFLLHLLSTPTVFTSMLSMVMLTQPAHAVSLRSTPVIYTADGRACVHSPHGSYPTPLVCIRRTNNNAVASQATQVVASNQVTSTDPAKLEFTDEESNAAIKLFGCDCPACVSALRNLRGLPGLPM